MSARFQVALLSEDRSEGTWRGLKAVLLKLLRRFEDDGYTQRVDIQPADANVRPVVIANRWRSTSPKDQAAKRELWRYVARKISEPKGFVVFHYDGDERWSRRALSKARAQFDREIRTRVAQVLSGSNLTQQEITRRMARLIECVPFYSTEAWLYQATERAKALCEAHHRGEHVGQLDAWAADRTLLDDVLKPKDECCLQDEYNEDLGRHVPVRDVVETGRSMTWFVWSLYACGELHDAIDLIH